MSLGFAGRLDATGITSLGGLGGSPVYSIHRPVYYDLYCLPLVIVGLPKPKMRATGNQTGQKICFATEIAFGN